MQDVIAPNIVIPYYWSYGTTHRLAAAVEEGAAEEAGASVRLRRVPELPEAEEAMSGQDAYDAAQAEMADVPRVDHDDLRWADGIIWGTPTRFGRADLDRQGRADQAVRRHARGPVVRGRAGGNGHRRLRVDRLDP
jgi:hypothetical protein